MWNRYVRIMVILGMIAVMCGVVNAATGIVAETQATAVGAYPACTAPCECISESNAAMQWGAEGYEKCSKTICGQDANGDIQYYCIHRIGSTAPPTTVPASTTSATAITAPVVSTATTVNAAVTSVTTPAVPAPASPTVTPIATKTPVGFATILIAIGAALLVTAGTSRK
jgi:hypothetical protein